MLTARLLAAALALGLATLPARADDVCDPVKGRGMAVTGVAANDTLNMRKSPSASAEIDERLKPGAKGLTSTGRSRQTTDACALACVAVGLGADKAALAVAKDCKARGRIWYEVRSAAGRTGWVSGRFILPGAAVAVPPISTLPAPAEEPLYRYTCQNGERINVTLRAGTQDAEVVTKDGRFLYLGRKAGGPAINYASPAFGGMALRGTAARVVWQAPGKSETTCVERP